MIVMLNAVGLSKIKKFKMAGGIDSTVLPVLKVKHIQIWSVVYCAVIS